MNEYLGQSEKWIKEWVIGLNLCPFANRVVKNKALRLALSNAKTAEDLVIDLLKELEFLLANDASVVDTTVIVHPFVLDDFEDYLDFVTMAEGILIELGHEGVFQLASFHPKYQFAGTSPDDRSNYTNRSPYPMLHLLREESVSAALELYLNPELIPERNIDLLEKMPVEEFTRKLNFASLK